MRVASVNEQSPRYQYLLHHLQQLLKKKNVIEIHSGLFAHWSPSGVSPCQNFSNRHIELELDLEGVFTVSKMDLINGPDGAALKIHQVLKN